MPGQVATTCPLGRDTALAGFPIRVAELLSALVTPAFIARVSMHTPLEIVKAKALIKRAFRYQTDGTCFSMVECLSTCPTNWGIAPVDSLKWLEENMLPYYPLGIYKTPEGKEA